MFNISEKTEIIGLEQTGCTREHIQYCLSDYHKYETPKFKFHGRIVSKGDMVLHLKTGDFKIYFDEAHGWARKIEIEGRV